MKIITKTLRVTQIDDKWPCKMHLSALLLCQIMKAAMTILHNPCAVDEPAVRAPWAPAPWTRTDPRCWIFPLALCACSTWNTAVSFGRRLCDMCPPFFRWVFSFDGAFRKVRCTVISWTFQGILEESLVSRWIFTPICPQLKQRLLCDIWSWTRSPGSRGFIKCDVFLVFPLLNFVKGVCSVLLGSCVLRKC